MPSPCNPNVAAAGTSKQEAEELLQRAMTLAELRSARTGQPMADALRSIAGELRAEENIMSKVQHRNALMTVQKKQDIKKFVGRFIQAGRSAGEGILAMLQGSSRKIMGARQSVDYQSKAIHGKYFGRLVAEMDKAGVLSAFKNPDENMLRDIYREMGGIAPGQPAKMVTQNKTAFAIAQIIEGVMAEVVARQNRAGAYIVRMPGYIARQTHDQSAIRAMGGIGHSQQSKSLSYQGWSKFVKPLIDVEKTTKGADLEKVLRNIHEGLYSGIHGAARDEMDVMGVTVLGSLAKKVSESRVLHFRDADAALKYNQAFGIKDLKEQILHDLHVRTRSIALMENLGPSPEATLRQVIRELEEEARTADDAAKHVDSLKDWRIMAAFNEITGRNEMSASPTLSNVVGTAKVIAQVAKMGAVVLSSFSDRAFLQAEMAFQGMNHLQTFVGQLGTVIKGPEQKTMLRYMGIAMDGLMGNALSRYSNHSTTSGWAHELQKHFFNLNGLNLWTDAAKGTAGLLMSAHLGDHAHLRFEDLPANLSNVLSLYNITRLHWDAIRSHVVDHGGQKYIMPMEGLETHDPAMGMVDSNPGLRDPAKKTPGEIPAAPNVFLAELLKQKGLKPTLTNLRRERDLIDTSLRTYFSDRVDHAVPTPGAAERKYSTFDTRAGTPLGEAVRLVMLFKSFPVTILRKILGREIYGRGADSLRQWLQHDHQGKFQLAILIAMGTAIGYTSGAVKDMLRGRTPKPLVDENGDLIWKNINDAALRGGSLGIMGDVLMAEYESSYRGFLASMAGPVVGQADALMDIKTGLQRGEDVTTSTGKLLLDNAPLINLFYIRPILDYLVLWNLQEMMSPGSLGRMESAVQRNNKQGFFMRPSEVVR